MLRHACGYKLANDGHRHPSLAAAFTRQVPRLLARLAGAVRRISNALDVRAADATPGRGDFWILKIGYAASPENLPKNGFCPLKGVAFLTEDVFEKKFQVRESNFAGGASASA